VYKYIISPSWARSEKEKQKMFAEFSRRLEYLSLFQSARVMILKRFSLTIDIKYVYWINVKGESYDSLLFTQQIVTIIWFFFPDNSDRSQAKKLFLGTSENLHALKGYCSLGYMLSYKISVCGID